MLQLNILHKEMQDIVSISSRIRFLTVFSCLYLLQKKYFPEERTFWEILIFIDLIFMVILLMGVNNLVKNPRKFLFLGK